MPPQLAATLLRHLELKLSRSLVSVNCEDFTSLAGLPISYHIKQVVLLFDGRAVKITSVCDTGAPDIIMTQVLYRRLNLKGHTDASKTPWGLE